MSNETFWAIIGVLIGAGATLFGTYIAQRAGLIQVSLMGKAHDLNLLLAESKVGTDIRVDERYDNGSNFPPFLYLITSIYNEGQLPAKQLHGQWQLSSANTIRKRNIPINREVLGSVPYQLDPCRLEESSAWSGSLYHFRFDVHIEFDYLSLPNNKHEHYSKKYSYDPTIKQMVPSD